MPGHQLWNQSITGVRQRSVLRFKSIDLAIKLTCKPIEFGSHISRRLQYLLSE
jgi:hypothetical protein